MRLSQNVCRLTAVRDHKQDSWCLRVDTHFNIPFKARFMDQALGVTE